MDEFEMPEPEGDESMALFLEELRQLQLRFESAADQRSAKTEDEMDAMKDLGRVADSLEAFFTRDQQNAQKVFAEVRKMILGSSLSLDRKFIAAKVAKAIFTCLGY
jgi:hypothetical protein